MEGKIFGRRSGKRDVKTKWKKNVFRTAVVLVAGGIAMVGAGDLDKFVSLIGSFAVSFPSWRFEAVTDEFSVYLWSTFTLRTCTTRV